MAKLKIFTFPDSVLAKKASPIQRVDKSYYRLADDMLETMYHAPGIGLAANQVGILERILVLDVEYDLYDLEDASEELVASAEVVGSLLIKNKRPKVLLNPQIISAEGKIHFKEGCLSVPEFSAEVKRFEKLKLQYQDLDGLTRTLTAEGLLAVAIQHEMDHLEGKLFIDRLSPLKKEMVKKKLIQKKAVDPETPFEERRTVSSDSKKKNKGF